MQSEVAAGAEVLALGVEHLQPVGIVHHEQVAVCVRGEACRAEELVVLLLVLGAELPLVVALAVEDLHAVVVAISDCHFSRRAKHRDSSRAIKLAVADSYYTCAGEDANEGAVERKL
jgi:hypothetical protein